MELFKPGNDTYFNVRPKPNVRLKPSDSSFYLNLSLEWSLTFEHPYDEEGRWKLIEGDSVILIESPFHLQKQAFVVDGIEKGLYSMTVSCHHYFIESAYVQVMDRRADNAIPQKALDVLFKDTEFNGKADAGFMTENNIYFVQDNILNFIKGSGKENTLYNRWGGEFFYDNRTLKWYEHLNKDKIFKISFSNNLTDLGLEEDWKGIYTRIYPKAYNGRTIPEPHYIDSENIDKYARVKSTWVNFDDLGLIADYEHYNPDSPPDNMTLFETEEELEEAIREKVQQLFAEGLDLPTVTGTVNAAMLHNSIGRKGTTDIPGLGYTVKAYNKLTNMEYQSRIIGIDWNTVKKCFNSIELGDAGTNTNFFDKIESTVDKVVGELEESNKVDWNQVIKDTIDELTDYINNGTYYGHIKITKQEFLILDDEDINKAKKVWRWNMGGLGFSTNGYGGPFQTAITAAGKMVINELTAETLKASMIKAGVLASLDEKCWISLDDGTFNFADKMKWDGEEFILEPTSIMATIKNAINGGSDKLDTVQVTIDNKGLTVKNGAIKIKNKAGATVLSGDVNGNLLLDGTVKTQRGEQYVAMSSGGIDFKDAHKDEQIMRAGIGYFSANRDQNGVNFALAQCGDYVRFSHISKNDLTSGWTASDKQYIFFDMWQAEVTIGSSRFRKGITVYAPMYTNDSIRLNYKGGENTQNVVTSSAWNGVTGMLGLYGDNGTCMGYQEGNNLMSRIVVTEAAMPGTGDNIKSWGNWNCSGYTVHNATFVGKFVNTYANTLTKTFIETNCIEAENKQVRVNFKDILLKDGKATLNIPNKYVHIHTGYIISSLVKKGRGDVWVSQEFENRFIIEGTKDIKINVEVVILLDDDTLYNKRDKDDSPLCIDLSPGQPLDNLGAYIKEE